MHLRFTSTSGTEGPDRVAAGATITPPRPWFAARPLVALAPMEGVTDSPFRQAAREVAPSAILFTEFTSAKGLLFGGERVWRLIRFVEAERPLVVQIFGAEPSVVSEAAARIDRELHPDGIDLNFGCPVRKVASRGEGCALMKDPGRAREIVQAVKAAITVPLSGKIRLGWESKEEAVPFALALQEAGLELVTVHGRVRRGRPRDPADWETIARVKAALRIPVVGNGDVMDGPDARARLAESGVDGVMIARAAMGNPWVLEETRAVLAGETAPPPPGIAERLRVLRRHMELNLLERGPRHGVISMRKHFGNYIAGFPGAKDVRTRLNEIETREGVLDVLAALEATHTAEWAERLTAVERR